MSKQNLQKSKFPPKGSFPKSSDKTSKPTSWDTTGPQSDTEVKENCGCNKKNTNPPKKINESDINTFMSNKSLFERLFEDVMGDEEALGLPAPGDESSPEGMGEEGMGEEGEDTVTLTLDRATAEKLHDLLGSILGGEEEGEEEGGEFGEEGEEFGEEGGEEEGGALPESSEIEELGTRADMTKKGAMKTGASLQMGGTTAQNAKVDVQGNPTPAPKYSQKPMKVTDLPSDIAFKKTGKAVAK